MRAAIAIALAFVISAASAQLLTTGVGLGTFGGGSAGGGGCAGVIDLSAGCALPMLGGAP